GNARQKRKITAVSAFSYSLQSISKRHRIDAQAILKFKNFHKKWQGLRTSALSQCIGCHPADLHDGIQNSLTDIINVLFVHHSGKSSGNQYPERGISM